MEGAAIDFVRDAFGHLKAIAVDKGGRALLKTANVGQDAGVVDTNDTGDYRYVEDAPMGPGKVRPGIGMTAGIIAAAQSKPERIGGSPCVTTKEARWGGSCYGPWESRSRSW
jgi:hypothetical protein